MTAHGGSKKMQASNQSSAAVQEQVTYVLDQDSGWERHEGIVWHIDEGNAADWEDTGPYVIE